MYLFYDVKKMLRGFFLLLCTQFRVERAQIFIIKDSVYFLVVNWVQNKGKTDKKLRKRQKNCTD